MPDPRTTQDDQAALYRALAAGEHRSGGAGRGTVAFAVSTDDVEAGAGDVYVALGLAKYLARRGWGVLLWPTERWETPLPEDVTVVVSMIESFVPGLVPQHVGLVAWVRNWTDVWAEQPWLDEYDAVWTSSTAARDRIAERTERPVRVLPIGGRPRALHRRTGRPGRRRRGHDRELLGCRAARNRCDRRPRRVPAGGLVRREP
ncbi:hypothetical protein [Curtobacterium citreum]|uniref:hypothetical protein n=1 Tax=Curtobacterium citreum TaxID=2036 RepID=UPI0031D282D4